MPEIYPTKGKIIIQNQQMSLFSSFFDSIAVMMIRNCQYTGVIQKVRSLIHLTVRYAHHVLLLFNIVSLKYAPCVYCSHYGQFDVFLHVLLSL